MPFIPDKDTREKDSWTHTKEKTCRHPEHNQPSNMVYRSSGIWVCPACGATQRIIPDTTY